MDDMPGDYDAIIVGTGMTESIVAAALSRIGKTVLHLDANDYYGDNWASFSLNGFEKWIKSQNENGTNEDENSNETYSDLINETEKIVKVKPNLQVLNASLNYFAVKSECFKECDTIEKQQGGEVKGTDAVVESKILKEPEENLHKLSRKFNLDLCPKLLFSKGMLVDLLITSNIARYAEFKSVSRVLTWREGQLEPVPCSRADVFATKNVTVVHKRILVKILTLFANYTENLEEFRGFEKKTFLEYLKHKKLPENLIHYILYAIAMGDNATSCLDGVKNCKHFLESLGRYGNTPFIFPIYGSGELPQCFCRLCAVFGGTYCLQRKVEALIMKDNKCVGVISNKKRLNAKTVILSSKYAPAEFLRNDITENISRAIFITDRSILKGDKEALTLLQFPPVSTVSDKSVTVIELGSGTCTCPENYFVVHMTAKANEDALSDFRHVVESLFGGEIHKKNSKPNVLWSVTWNVVKATFKSSDLGIKNVKICCSVDTEFDYDICISKAKNIFTELFPEEEFLPRAPDPEEIVLDAIETSNESPFVEIKLDESCGTEPVAEETSHTAKEKQTAPENISEEEVEENTLPSTQSAKEKQAVPENVSEEEVKESILSSAQSAKEKQILPENVSEESALSSTS